MPSVPPINMPQAIGDEADGERHAGPEDRCARTRRGRPGRCRTSASRLGEYGGRPRSRLMKLASGSLSGSHGARTAASTISTSQPTQIQNVRARACVRDGLGLGSDRRRRRRAISASAVAVSLIVAPAGRSASRRRRSSTLTTTNAAVMIITIASTTGKSSRSDGFDDRRAEARDAEDVLDDQRTTDQRTGVDAEHRDEREQRRAQGVLEQHVPARHALAPRHQDEVLLQRGDQVGAQQALVDRGRGQRDRRAPAGTAATAG